MAKRKKKKVIVPGNASKRRYEEEHRLPESKYNISKAGWYGLVALSAALLIASALTSNILFAAIALAVIIFVDRNGKNLILADYNDLLEKRRLAMGMSEDLSDEERKGLMQALTEERIRVRREKKDRKKAERLGISYEDSRRSARGTTRRASVPRWVPPRPRTGGRSPTGSSARRAACRCHAIACYFVT